MGGMSGPSLPRSTRALRGLFTLLTDCIKGPCKKT